MGDLTSIQVPRATRDRLRRFGLKGQTWADILDRLMERVEYEEFMNEQYALLEQRKKFVPLEDA
ncbi:MAG: hypothetical protein ACT4PT_09635 [Methanobacteriota archaeon]